MRIVCNVEDMTTVNGTWIVSFYNESGENAEYEYLYDSAEFDHKRDAVEYAKSTKRNARRDLVDNVTIIIDGNG